MDTRLLSLAGGAFAIGPGSLIVTGSLPHFASGRAVSIDAPGLLISIFALAYAVGSPILSTVLGDADRKAVPVSYTHLDVYKRQLQGNNAIL